MTTTVFKHYDLDTVAIPLMLNFLPYGRTPNYKTDFTANTDDFAVNVTYISINYRVKNLYIIVVIR